MIWICILILVTSTPGYSAYRLVTYWICLAWDGRKQKCISRHREVYYLYVLNLSVILLYNCLISVILLIPVTLFSLFVASPLPVLLPATNSRGILITCMIDISSLGASFLQRFVATFPWGSIYMEHIHHIWLFLQVFSGTSTDDLFLLKFLLKGFQFVWNSLDTQYLPFFWHTTSYWSSSFCVITKILKKP